jgi:hypothetical protein
VSRKAALPWKFPCRRGRNSFAAWNLFVFAEEPHLSVKRRGEAVELALEGAFKARRLPCQDTDLVIHLTRPAMARLVALVLSLARGDL